jgi:hypothetical protein
MPKNKLLFLEIPSDPNFRKFELFESFMRVEF